MRILVAGMLGLLLVPWSLAAEARDAELVRPKLLADVASIRPGQTFTAGILFELKPGWHIYWKNPGDSGMATAVQFKPPEKFTVSTLRWPVPIVFNQPDDWVGYGYSDSVLLSARITAPQDLPPGTEVTIAADTQWLCCERVCVPGNRKLELKLPVAPASTSANQEVFAHWERRLPRESAANSTPVVANVDGAFTVKLDWHTPPTAVEWIPATPEALALEKVAVVTQGQQTTISFTARILRGQKPPSDDLESVVAYTDSAGERRGIIVRIPLSSFRPGK